jgi:hypothetical protein
LGIAEVTVRALLNVLWLFLLEGLFLVCIARPLDPLLLGGLLVLGFLVSLPGAVVYLAVLEALPPNWRHRTRRAAAVLLSPLVLVVFWWLFSGAGAGILIFLIGTTAYGLTVGLPGEQTPFGTIRRGASRVLRSPAITNLGSTR